MDYYAKYIKYKTKYLELKKQMDGGKKGKCAECDQELADGKITKDETCGGLLYNWDPVRQVVLKQNIGGKEFCMDCQHHETHHKEHPNYILKKK